MDKKTQDFWIKFNNSLLANKDFNKANSIVGKLFEENSKKAEKLPKKITVKYLPKDPSDPKEGETLEEAEKRFMSNPNRWSNHSWFR